MYLYINKQFIICCVVELKKIIKDVLYISKITRTKNKKLLIIASVFLAQLAAFSDIFIISIFSAILVDQFTSIEFVNIILLFSIDNPVIIFLVILVKYFSTFMQSLMLKKLELTVNKNLKEYFLEQIFEKRNYTVADSYFFINTLTMHISFFYSSFSNFLNGVFQILIFSLYLIISDINAVLIFGVGVIILTFPVKLILRKAKYYMNVSYTKSQESFSEIQRVVDNLFLIKVLKQNLAESKKFSSILQEYNSSLLNNHKYGILNTSLPGFLTLFILTVVLMFTAIGKMLTLDFIGVMLRLFQSLSILANSLNQIINSHVHIEKFYELEQNKLQLFKKNYKINDSESIAFNNVTFNYYNDENPVFENISFRIPKNTHISITGPNGSGKSTLLGLIAGVFYSRDGSVVSYSEKLSYVGAKPYIFNSTLYENIMYGNNLTIDSETILFLLKKLNTFKESENYNLDKMISNTTLSSGQMQKIAFIRAFLSSPDIILLDEATANLDSESKAIIFKLLSEENITIINSTHDPESFQGVDSNLNIEVVREKRKITITKL
jgi:ABC-type multidrug transport system fused ATPase/permease subunit